MTMTSQAPTVFMSAPSMNIQLTAAQGDLLEPEGFQANLIANIGRALLRDNHPPCLLRAPTGSGKTFMLARVLANVSAEAEVLWFWFVPFVNLVTQTLDALVSNASDLSPQALVHGRNQEPAAGQVLISTVQAVARAKSRTQGYNADSDDDTRSLAELVARARGKGLAIGMVVDEAHIALDHATEFGRFAQWLNPDYQIMATATPKDQRLNEFLTTAGKSNFESFAVSRDEVVAARLNKKYIEAVIYDLRQSVQTVADLGRTVLRQAWARNQRIKTELAAAGIPLTPLLLVQVANGDKTVEEAERDLVTLCKVPIHAIGKHSSNDPDPALMSSIAFDSTKEVLIFKQSAGTGFDAPRAFVLASTKSVSDPDFAMQFIGRVMRVAAPLRAAWPRHASIPPDFDTAYVYLANADAQRGFEAAVEATSQVRSQLEGQTEKLEVRQTLSGAVSYTNKATPQTPLRYDLPLPDGNPVGLAEAPAPQSTLATSGPQRELFAAQAAVGDDQLDIVAPMARETPVPRRPDNPRTGEELLAALGERGLRAYPLRMTTPGLPRALKRERRPEMLGMSAISRQVATRLEIPPKLIGDAIRAAQNRLREIERHTELTTRSSHDEDVLIVTDRNALAREAMQALRKLPQVEDEDIRVMLEVLVKRLVPELENAYEVADDGQRPDAAGLQRLARDAAHWIAKQRADTLDEAIHEAIAATAKMEEAGPLPDAMVFPEGLPLASSRKNIYGCYPPDKEELARVEQTLLPGERAWLKERHWQLDGSEFFTGEYDATATLNGEERAFAQALDRSPFVTWWHRNPDRKSYSVRLVRGEHRNFFHPDFVVCLEHFPGDEPLIRLIETKENVKDASRKSRHVPSYYGKVLFLTKDQTRLKWVKDDGSLGSDVDLDDLTELREYMRSSIPQQT